MIEEKKMTELLVTRLEEAKRQGRLFTIHTADGNTYTPDDIINEARQETPIGKEFLSAEKKLMDYLKRRLTNP